MQTATKTAPFTVNARNVVFTEDVIITVPFKGGITFHGFLADLKEFVRTQKLDAPLGCTTELGRHGVYPCLRANRPELVRAINLLKKTQLVKGDGITYRTRGECMKDALALKLAGYTLKNEDILWGITELPYANAPQTAASTHKPKPTAEEALAADESPF